MTQFGEGVSTPSMRNDKNNCGDHDWECHPIERKKSNIDEVVIKLENGNKAGDKFEARCVKHNQNDIQSGEDIGAEFRCKNCPATKEIDHVTRNKSNGAITKIVQCKSDQSKISGNKGVKIKPAQLREDRKLNLAISECQESDPPVEIEYKLEAGDAAQHAADFLKKKDPPIITFVN